MLTEKKPRLSGTHWRAGPAAAHGQVVTSTEVDSHYGAGIDSPADCHDEPDDLAAHHGVTRHEIGRIDLRLNDNSRPLEPPVVSRVRPPILVFLRIRRGYRGGRRRCRPLSTANGGNLRYHSDLLRLAQRTVPLIRTAGCRDNLLSRWRCHTRLSGPRDGHAHLTAGRIVSSWTPRPVARRADEAGADGILMHVVQLRLGHPLGEQIGRRNRDAASYLESRLLAERRPCRTSVRHTGAFPNSARLVRVSCLECVFRVHASVVPPV